MSEAAATKTKQPLDEVMLAMDVVDTLRHHLKLVERELDADTRDEQLKEKLRKIYHTQGIEVPDHVLEEGVQALREDRFSYRPPKNSLTTRLARIYISRNRWGKWLTGMVAVCLLSWVAYQFMVAGPRSVLPQRIESGYQVVWHSAKSDKGRDMAQQIYARAQTAQQKNDREGMEKALASLDQLKQALDQEYTLRIVAGPGVQSGVWRVPDINTSARNYYIIVEAVDADGKVLHLPVTSEETGKKTMVSKWGMRVDKDVFQAIAADKQDDGIIQGNIFGEKKKGHLEPSYILPTSGGAITSW